MIFSFSITEKSKINLSMTNAKRFVALPQKRIYFHLLELYAWARDLEMISIRIIKRQLCFSAVAPSPLSKTVGQSSVKQLLLMKRMKKPSKPQYLKVHISFWQILNDAWCRANEIHIFCLLPSWYSILHSLRKLRTLIIIMEKNFDELEIILSFNIYEKKIQNF